MKTPSLRRIAPGRYEDPVTGRFVVEQTRDGWRWFDSHQPSVGGEWRRTMREAVRDLDAHDATRSALDIMKGWMK